MTIESRHAADAGTQDNILGLDDAILKKRVVETLDVAFDPLDPKYYKKEEDPTIWVSKKKERGPLEKGWQEKCEPMMCCYKLVTIEFRYMGFQRRMEGYLDAMLKALMFTFSRQVICMMDEWANLSYDEVLEMEKGIQEELNRRCGALHIDTSHAESEQVQLESTTSPDLEGKDHASQE